MNAITKKKALQGIASKIEHYTKHLNAHKKGLREAKTDYKTKENRQHGNGFAALNIEYSESYTEKVLREYPIKIEKYENILKDYKEAQKDLTENY